MNLREFINEFWKEDESKVLCIGSATGYFFIGNKATFDKTWEKATTIFVKRATQRKETSYMTLSHTLSRPLSKVGSDWSNLSVPGVVVPHDQTDLDAINSYYKKVLAEYEKVTAEVKLLGRYLSSISHATTRIRTANEYLTLFVPFLEREVKNSYYNPDFRNWSCIIEGYENGDFWMQEEFDKKVLSSLEDTWESEEDDADE